MSFGEAVGCPLCGRQISHDAIRCKNCGALLSEGAGRRKARGRFRIVLAIITITAASATVVAANLINIHNSAVEANQSATR